MRKQKVSVDIWKMVFSSCSYLALAFVAWLFLKLICACFWLPKYLQTQQVVEETNENTEKQHVEDKKNI